MRQKLPELRDSIRASPPHAAIFLQFATSHTGGYNSPARKIKRREIELLQIARRERGLPKT